MAGAVRPLAGCPARSGGDGLGVDDAEFVFCAEDCRNGGVPVTEVFGFFCRPGWRDAGMPRSDDDDAVLTAGFEVPAGSPISRLAHQADTRTGVAVIGGKLRGAIAACQCSGTGKCAALDELNFLAAIEAAAGTAGRPWWQRQGRGRTRGLWHD